MGRMEMADPTKHASRQERYRLNLIAARDRVPKLEAEIARLKEKLAKLTYKKPKAPTTPKSKRGAK